jgi:maleylpyruvate isomerase
MTPLLRSYYRSSCSWRVRIALNWKGLGHDVLPVHLVRDGGEQFAVHFQRLNPMAQVPVLSLPEGDLTQSMAILEYLEECHPEPALMPSAPFLRARVRQLAEVINSGTQPLQNLSVLRLLVGKYGLEEQEARGWAHFWIDHGLTAFHSLCRENAGAFCVGDQVTFADLCLIPQLYNARRFGVPTDSLPLLLEIESRLSALPAFQDAHPDKQSAAA